MPFGGRDNKSKVKVFGSRKNIPAFQTLINGLGDNSGVVEGKENYRTLSVTKDNN